MYVKANDDTGRWDIFDCDAWVAELESESTAQLFAAAPHLKAALEGFIEYLMNDGRWRDYEADFDRCMSNLIDEAYAALDYVLVKEDDG